MSDDVRREPTPQEYGAANILYEQIKGCQGHQLKIERLLAYFIRDWNIDVAERDEIVKLYVKYKTRHAASTKRWRAKQKQKDA
jgi:hypothetical protein